MSEENTEVLDTHTEDQEEETPEVEAELTKEQIEELKRNAEVSSQNFERAKKAETKAKTLETELDTLKAQLATTETEQFVDPSEQALAKIQALESKIASIEEQKEFETLYALYPVLKDKKDAFDTYRAENQGMKVATAAKAFLVENDLLGEQPKRKGLEKAGGGNRVPPQSGKMAAQDAERLRKTNYKEYMKLVRSGKLQIAK